MSVRALIAVGACCAGLALLGGCGIVQISHGTRYFATERDAGKTIQLHKGDEVTLNLVIANGRDWSAFSSDVQIAKPATTEEMVFSSGERPASSTSRSSAPATCCWLLVLWAARPARDRTRDTDV